jgi:hypothetical protein
MEQENQQPQGTQDNHQSAENIVKGASNEDQLDKFKESVEEGGRDAYPDQHAGTPPDAYNYEREEKSGDTTAESAE